MNKKLLSFCLLFCVHNSFADTSKLINGIDFFQLGISQNEVRHKAKISGGNITPISDDDQSFYPAADPIIFEGIKSKNFSLDWVNAYFEKNKLYRVELFNSPWVSNNEMGGFSFDAKKHNNFLKVVQSLTENYQFSEGVETEVFEGAGGEHACDNAIILKKKTWRIKSSDNIFAAYTETKMLEPTSRRELSINDAATMDCRYPAEASIIIYDKNIDTQVMLINEQKRLEWEQKHQH